MFNAPGLTKDKTHLPEVSAVISNDCSPSELIHAVHNQQLKLQYQPRYDSQTGQFIRLCHR